LKKHLPSVSALPCSCTNNIVIYGIKLLVTGEMGSKQCFYTLLIFSDEDDRPNNTQSC